MHSALSSIVKPNALSSFKSMVTSLAGSGIPCHKLTSENFKNYGHVVQAYSTAAEAPKGIATFEAPDGKTLKFHEVASVTNTYPATAAASTGISVFRCTEKSGMQQGKPWPIHFMERHPHTDQAFIPMGVSSVSSMMFFAKFLRPDTRVCSGPGKLRTPYRPVRLM